MSPVKNTSAFGYFNVQEYDTEKYFIAICEGNDMVHIVGAIILSVVAIGCLIFSCLQFNEKGFLFHNAYIFASDQQRKTMDKKLFYKQSGIIFFMIGIIFFINAAEMIFETGWLFYLVTVVAVLAIVYAIVSSVVIERNKK